MAINGPKQKKYSKVRELWRLLKKNRSAMIGLVTITTIILIALCADWIAPYEQVVKQNAAVRFQPPSSEHWFGTDAYGRNIFARVIHGSRYSLSIGIYATLFSMLIGGPLGAIAGFYGGKVDNIIMRFIDTLTSIPAIMSALIVITALGSSLVNLIIAVSVANIPVNTRIVRSAVLPVVHQEFIEAAYAGGTRDARIIINHVIPNAVGPTIVQTTMSVAHLILRAAGLSFLGLGVPAPAPEWGSMLSEAGEYMRRAPYMMIFPGLALMLTALSINLLGDGLRDALDPRLKS